MSEAVGVVTIINKFKVQRKNQAFQCLMIYQDLDTEYCFIIPLLGKNDVEISMELFRIFTTFGAPKELHVNSCNQDLINTIADNIKMLCPMFKVEFIRKIGDKNDVAMKVVTELHKWTEKTKKEEWEIGCCQVQYKLNTQVNKRTKLSPQDRMFPSKTKGIEDPQRTRVENEYIVPDNEPVLQQTERKTNNLIQNPEDPGSILPDVEPEKNLPVRVKKEVIEEEDSDYNINEKVEVFEDCMIFPGLRKMPCAEVEVKMERLDEW